MVGIHSFASSTLVNIDGLSVTAKQALHSKKTDTTFRQVPLCFHCVTHLDKSATASAQARSTREAHAVFRLSDIPAKHLVRLLLQTNVLQQTSKLFHDELRLKRRPYAAPRTQSSFDQSIEQCFRHCVIPIYPSTKIDMTNAQRAYCAAQDHRTTVYDLLSLSVAKRYDQPINSTRPEGKQRTAYAVRVRSFAQLWHVAKTNLLRAGVAGP